MAKKFWKGNWESTQPTERGQAKGDEVREFIGRDEKSYFLFVEDYSGGWNWSITDRRRAGRVLKQASGFGKSSKALAKEIAQEAAKRFASKLA